MRFRVIKIFAITAMGAVLGSWMPVISAPDVSPCVKPLRYRLGRFDSRFGITQLEMMKALRKAEEIWEAQTGKNLFKYDPSAPFTVNMIYGQLQRQTMSMKRVEGNLDQLEKQHQGKRDKLMKVQRDYDTLKAKYDAEVATYESELKAYNRRVNKWNKRGGAPPDVFEKLQAEGRKMERREQEVDQLRLKLNSKVAQLNRMVRQVNTLVNRYNRQVYTYRERYGGARRFRQGDYTPNRINLYQFFDLNDLALILAHEMGHALGIGHVRNSKSVMYYLMGDQNLDDPKLTAEDVAALRQICRKSKR